MTNLLRFVHGECVDYRADREGYSSVSFNVYDGKLSIFAIPKDDSEPVRDTYYLYVDCPAEDNYL